MKRLGAATTCLLVSLAAVACENAVPVPDTSTTTSLVEEVITTTTSTSSTTTTAPQTTTDATSPDVEYQLAVIDMGRPPSDEEVQRYAVALESAEMKCNEERRMTGDMAVRATQLLDENYGMSVDTLESIEGIDVAVPAGEPLDCREVLSALIVLMGEE